jgi:hypothetical protein
MPMRPRRVVGSDIENGSTSIMGLVIPENHIRR